MIDLLSELNRESGTTLVLVTHDARPGRGARAASCGWPTARWSRTPRPHERGHALRAHDGLAREPRRSRTPLAADGVRLARRRRAGRDQLLHRRPARSPCATRRARCSARTLGLGSSARFSERAEAELRRLAGAAEVSRVVRFAAMAYAPSGSGARLVQVSAVEGGYPVLRHDRDRPARGVGPPRPAIARCSSTRRCSLSLSARVGDTLALGDGALPHRRRGRERPGRRGRPLGVRAARVHVRARPGRHAPARLRRARAVRGVREAARGRRRRSAFPSATGPPGRGARQPAHRLGPGSRPGPQPGPARPLPGPGRADRAAPGRPGSRERGACPREAQAGDRRGAALPGRERQHRARGLRPPGRGPGRHRQRGWVPRPAWRLQALLPALLGDFLPVATRSSLSWSAAAAGLGVGVWTAAAFALLSAPGDAPRLAARGAAARDFEAGEARPARSAALDRGHRARR